MELLRQICLLQPLKHINIWLRYWKFIQIRFKLKRLVADSAKINSN